MSQRPIPLALGTTALTLRGEMDALPLLVVIVEALKQSRLEAVLIGNAAAALRGAPVTTVDFDFFFRKTAANLKKLKTFAGLVGGRILKPYHPASDLYRVVNEDRGLQVDFLSTIHGVRSFAALRALAEPMAIGQTELWVASLKDIVASKKAAGRARDLAVVEILERTLREANKVENRKRKSPQAGE